MTTVKLRIKINNSYDTEPSSGSGSSMSESNECETSTYEPAISNLQHMLHPHLCLPDQLRSPQVKEDCSQWANRYNEQIRTSDESDFEGFTDSQIGYTNDNVPKFSKHGYAGTALNTEAPGVPLCDIFIEQESCNAVDIKYSHNNEVENTKPVSNLSFNGKIASFDSHAQSIKFKGFHGDTDKVRHVQGNLSVDETEIANFKYVNERSPDLFEDDDLGNCEENKAEEDAYERSRKSINYPRDSCFTEENNENGIALKQSIKREKELLKRIKTCLAGVPPPPSLTIPQVDIFSAVIRYKADILRFKDDVVQRQGSDINQEQASLFKPSHTIDELSAMSWKDSLCVRQHGLYYNICRASENVELLSLAIIERFIGAETSTSYTSFTNSPSSAKKRNMRQKMLTKSPGNRLSHLAKRRAIFSSANLATTSQKSNCVLDGMQILLDKKLTKTRRKGSTPRRMTPNIKNKNARKTPSSSARKRLLFQTDVVRVVPSRETSKRALFQSPAKHKKLPAAAVSKPAFKTDIAIRIEKSKRALFSPEKSFPPCSESVSLSQTSQSSLFGGEFDSLILKRKRTDDEESDLNGNHKKMFCPETETLTPRALKIKSQSFCIGAGSTNSNGRIKNILHSNSMISNDSINSQTTTNNTGRSITRASSDMIFPSSSHLTENQRKKLLWAVSQALQAKQVGVTHADFKKFASVLARVVRRIFQEYFQKSSCSTSETMLRLAKKYVYNVMSGKSADDIYLYAKSKIEDEKRVSSTRLSGYIARDEYESRKTISMQTGSLCNFENHPANMFSNPMTCLTQPKGSSENMKDTALTEQSEKSAIKLRIQPNNNLQNSSSKNNFGGTALRENLDSEQRRSAQKNFTGKDQRNVSPYINPVMRSSKKTTTFGTGLYGLSQSTIRAKRQISFDS